MHFRYDDFVYNVSIVDMISIREHPNQVSKEGWPIVTASFLFSKGTDKKPLHLKTDVITLGQFFYNWREGDKFFEFFIYEAKDIISSGDFKASIQKEVDEYETNMMK
jgi:hypothetical protein